MSIESVEATRPPASAPATVECTVREATATDRARWNGYVEQHRDASVYHRWEWNEIFAETCGTRAVALVAERAGRVVGVLPLSVLSRGPLGARVVSVPYFGHGGCIADDADAWRSLIARAREVGKRTGAQNVELRHAHAIPDALPTRDGKVLMHVALPDTVAALEKQIGSKMRNDVKRPQREGMTVEVGGIELVGAFHEAYANVMHDLGSPCMGRDVFASTLERMGDRAFVVRVVYQGRTAGAAFMVGMGDVLEVPCAGSRHALNKFRTNWLVYFTAMREAIERGYKTFSFGRSTVDAGTYQFKKNWGAQPVALPYHYLLTGTSSVPLAHNEHGALATVSKIWQRLPEPLCTAVGPHLVRHLP